MQTEKIVVFPIVITKTNDSKIKYSVYVPDLDRNTQGKDIADAVEMGKDLIGTMSLVEDLPNNNPIIPQIKENKDSFIFTSIEGYS